MIHSSINMSPFKAVYGVKPPAMMSYVLGTSHVDVVDSFLRERNEVLKDLHSHWMRARGWMTTVADHHRRDVTFEISDFVYLKLRLYRQTSIQFRASV